MHNEESLVIQTKLVFLDVYWYAFVSVCMLLQGRAVAHA